MKTTAGPLPGLKLTELSYVQGQKCQPWSSAYGPQRDGFQIKSKAEFSKLTGAMEDLDGCPKTPQSLLKACSLYYARKEGKG